MRRLALVAASTLAMACASHSTPSNPTPANPAAPPPAPPPSPTQTVRLGPSTLRYALAQTIHVEQELPTGPQTLDYGLRVLLRATINGPADSVGYPTTVTIDYGYELKWVGWMMGLLGADKTLNFTVASTMRRE